MSKIFGLVIYIMLQPILYLGSSEDVIDRFYYSDSSPDNHGTWGRLLDQYVDADGNVNYQGNNY